MAVQTSVGHRRPYRGSHTVTRAVGPASIAALVTAFAVLWLLARPRGDVGSFVGQLIGAEGVLLMSVGLVLISTLRWVEQFFDGVDKAAVWHRRVAIAGTILIGVHIATTGNRHPTHLGPTLGTIGVVGLATLTVWAIAPRWRSLTPRRLRRPVERLMETSAVQLVGRWVGSYGLWRGFHRLTGMFLAFGFVHGVMDSTVFGSQLLRWSYLVAGGIGIAFYLYRELLARHFAHTHDYEVSSVEPIDDASFEIWLRPLGERFAFRRDSSPWSTSRPVTAGTATPSPSRAGRRRRRSASPCAPSATSPRTSASSSNPVCRPSSAAHKDTSTTPAAPSTRSGSPGASASHRCSAGSARPARRAAAPGRLLLHGPRARSLADEVAHSPTTTTSSASTSSTPGHRPADG